MEEEGLSQRHAVDWVVQIVTLVQLHLHKERRGKRGVKLQKHMQNQQKGPKCRDNIGQAVLLIVLGGVQGMCGRFH